MLAPLLFVWPISIAFTHYFANNVAGFPYDQALREKVRTLARQIEVTDGVAHLLAPAVAQSFLRSDETDSVYFHLLDEQGKRLAITYFARGSGETTEREVSPQRLVYYRGNWYLDAWCHLRNDIRNFAIDSIRAAEVIEKKAREVSHRSMDEVLGPGYGIFSGRKLQHAVLRFTPERARWVAQETWHPKQKGRVEADGSWHLEFPYADHRELIMDILKFGADVEVLAPPDLRRRVAEEAARLTALYAAGPAKKQPERA